MSGPIYFISDLHLDDARPGVTQALEGFLAARRDAEALYILGDLFEYWIGDDDDSALVRRVANMLRDYSEAGPKLCLMHGNRDFLIGERFAARVEAELLDDPTVLEAQGQRLLLMHGDSLCTRDEEYQNFRRMARSASWQQSVLSQSLEARRDMATHLRKVSQDAGSRKADDIMDVTEREVERVMREHDCNTLIHGHTHRPARHEDRAGTRWVLGDWEQTGWYLELRDGELTLSEFAISEPA